ncbi:MFS transporter [Bauldia sp.]|uniref:MFS transporter n=1 Tax=Bauldia sp. TaxID=2575872 RepID=UPI003BAA1A67
MTHRPFAPQGRAYQRLAAKDPGDKGCLPASRPYVLAATILASAMAFIDSTVVNIAAPVIQAGFDASIRDLQWVLNSYLLMLGALMLVGGGLGDRIGRRRVFVIGIVVFAIASVACAIAPTVLFLIVARVAQGIGAALLVPQSLALISANYPKEIRGRAIGTWAAASAVTTALGPPLGGLLIDLLSWRMAFWINLPIAAVAIWLALKHIPESRDEHAVGSVDWQGALLATLGFGAVTYGLIAIGEPGGLPLLEFGLPVVGIILLAAFIAVEGRVRNPVMPLELFRSRVFTGGNMVTVLLYGALSGSLFLLPFDLLVRRELTTAEAGLTILPFGLIIGFMSRWMGALADRHGPRPFLIVGPLLVAVGCGVLALGLDSFWLGVMVPAIILAVGMGVVVSPLTTAVMNAAPQEKSGAASGVNNAASRLAGVIAVAVIGAVASLVYRAEAPADAPRFGLLPEADHPLRAAAESAFLSGYAVGMAAVAVGALLAAIAAFWTLPKGGAGTERVATEPASP